MRIKVSNNKELVEEIRSKLKMNVEKYGKPYCPCILQTEYNSENNEDYICMCKEFREQESGECHCGLYFKINE